MPLRFLFSLILPLVLASALVACGDDNDDVNPTREPEATDPVDNAEEDDGDDKAGNDGGEVADSRGSGTVVVDDETFDFTVDTCIFDGDSIIIGGPASTADGQSVYVSVESDEPFDLANLDVGVGSTSLFDVERGDPHYEAGGYAPDADFIPPFFEDPDLVVETNGEIHISFTTPEVDFDETVSFEVSCR